MLALQFLSALLCDDTANAATNPPSICRFVHTKSFQQICRPGRQARLIYFCSLLIPAYLLKMLCSHRCPLSNMWRASGCNVEENSRNLTRGTYHLWLWLTSTCVSFRAERGKARCRLSVVASSSLFADKYTCILSFQTKFRPRDIEVRDARMSKATHVHKAGIRHVISITSRTLVQPCWWSIISQEET